MQINQVFIFLVVQCAPLTVPQPPPPGVLITILSPLCTTVPSIAFRVFLFRFSLQYTALPSFLGSRLSLRRVAPPGAVLVH